MGEGVDPGVDPPPLPPQNEGTLRSFKYLPNIKYNGYRVLAHKIDFTVLAFGDLVEKILKQEEYGEIVKIGKNSVVIYCNTFEAANKLVDEPSLKEAGYNLYIPLYFVTSCGIIFDIDIQYTEEDIMRKADCRQFQPFKVERINRKEFKDGAISLCKTKRMKIYFHGTGIPQFIFISRVRVRCVPFIQRLIQCKNCWRIGHGKNTCRETAPKCSRCSKTHPQEEECMSESPKCMLCRANHPSDEKTCPERVRQTRIREAMAFNNMCRNEAMMLFPKQRSYIPTYSEITTSNSFHLLQDDEEFPALGTRKKNEPNFKAPEIPTHINPLEGSHLSRRPIQRRRSVSRSDARKRINKELSEDEAIEQAIQRSQKERRISSVSQTENLNDSFTQRRKSIMERRDYSIQKDVSHSQNQTPTASTSMNIPTQNKTDSTHTDYLNKIIQLKSKGEISEAEFIQATKKYVNKNYQNKPQQPMDEL